MKRQEIIIGIVALVLVFLIFKGIKDSFKNLFGTFGIGSTTEDDARESEIEKIEKKANEFSPTYWKNPPKGRIAQLMTIASTNAIIKNIESGIGYVWDTPEKILGSFRQLKYKTQVSWISDNWQKKHGTDLQAYL